ncbi:hypothetical protein V1283_002317 [Bradyrhizobium sp. AZCC 2262]
MAGAIDQGRLVPDKTVNRCAEAPVNPARAAGPPLLFGLRLWASVCLALYVAFWLELDDAYWAGASAAVSPSSELRYVKAGSGDRNRGRGHSNRGVDRMLSAETDRLSRGPGSLGRSMRFWRHGTPQLRFVFGGAHRLYRCSHRRRYARRHRKREFRDLLGGSLAHQRDLHRDCVRRHRISRKRCRPHKKISTWHSGKSRR